MRARPPMSSCPCRMPAWARHLETTVLLRAFARAFDVDAPSLRSQSASAALATYREFTAACMEHALQDDRLAQHLRLRLGREAYRLGSKVRRMLPVGPSHALGVARLLYQGIGIGLEGTLPGELRFCPCSFAVRYTPEDCWFMSAFDEGFLRGITGQRDCDLAFSCRLTEGADCCRARFDRPAHTDLTSDGRL